MVSHMPIVAGLVIVNVLFALVWLFYWGDTLINIFYLSILSFVLEGLTLACISSVYLLVIKDRKMVVDMDNNKSLTVLYCILKT